MLPEPSAPDAPAAGRGGERSPYPPLARNCAWISTRLREAQLQITARRRRQPFFAIQVLSTSSRRYLLLAVAVIAGGHRRLPRGSFRDAVHAR